MPAHPPLPTAWNLPFHVVLSGSHTSILMSESLDGVSVAATLQNADSVAYGLGWLAPRPPPRAPQRARRHVPRRLRARALLAAPVV